MIIQSIQIQRVAMPLIYPFRTAFGNDAVIEAVMVKLGEGKRFGWGEAAPWIYPAYSAECGRPAFTVAA